AKDGEVLGGHGLLQPEVNIQFGNRESFMLVQDADDLLTEFMIEGPQDHRGFFEVDKVNLHRCIVSPMGIDDHPVITACTIHDGKHVKRICKLIMNATK